MPTFEDDLTKLEGVVERLERGELTLDESVRLFEEGVRLSNACKTELEKAEGRIQILVQAPGGKLRPADMELEGEDDDIGPDEDDEEA